MTFQISSDSRKIISDITNIQIQEVLLQKKFVQSMLFFFLVDHFVANIRYIYNKKLFESFGGCDAFICSSHTSALQMRITTLAGKHRYL